MKGFKSRISDGDSYVWVYMKDGKIFEPKIKNIGKEKGFYGLDGHGSVDDTITDYENDVAPKIDLLRQQSAICEINDPSIIDFVAHCSEN